MRDKIDELDATVRLRREGRLEEALAIVKTDAGKEYMDRLRSGIGSFVTDCEMRRSEALKDSESRIQATGYAFIGLLLGIAALLASTAAMQAKGYRGLLRGTKRIAREALRDSLTGLSNRRDLARRLEEMQASGEATQSVTALFIDLDGFKAINDKLGHAVGDALLRRVSESLRRITRSGDTLARVGGDEFVVIALGLSDRSAIEKLCDRLVAEICVLQTVYGKVGLSIGIATQRGDDLVIEELLQEADKAMYDAKRSGGGYRFAMSLDAALV
jgi:diguanylate cyclase (GGDEF)-like protein